MAPGRVALYDEGSKPLEIKAFWQRKKVVDFLSKSTTLFGTPDGIRTHDLQSRSLTLYPAELRAHLPIYYSKTSAGCKEAFVVFSLKLNYDGLGVKRAYGCRAGLEVQDDAVAVTWGIHASELIVALEHVLAGLYAVVGVELACNTDPLAVFKCADLHLGVYLDLLEERFFLAGLDAELPVIDIDGAERPYSRLVSLDRGDEICACFLKEIIYSLHGFSSLLKICYNIAII